MPLPSSCNGKHLATSGAVTTVGVGGWLYGVNLEVTTGTGTVLIEDGGTGGTRRVGLSLDGSNTSQENQSKSIMFSTPISALI